MFILINLAEYPNLSLANPIPILLKEDAKNNMELKKTFDTFKDYFTPLLTVSFL